MNQGIPPTGAHAQCPAENRNASVSTRVLHEACLKLGGEENLSKYLQVDLHTVDGWLRGHASIPDWAFLRCLDLL